MLDVRYHGADNFVGAPVDGYEAPAAILTRPAADALRQVQERLRARGFGLKVFDAYRPQAAVDHFVRWAADPADRRTKAEYYPGVPKSELFSRGYIAEASGHSRGSTVDLTVVRLSDGAELDMGTPFDFFGAESAVDYPGLTGGQRANRRLLADAMQAHGFQPYAEEWWHYTLDDEPYPRDLLRLSGAVIAGALTGVGRLGCGCLSFPLSISAPRASTDRPPRLGCGPPAGRPPRA